MDLTARIVLQTVKILVRMVNVIVNLDFGVLIVIIHVAVTA